MDWSTAGICCGAFRTRFMGLLTQTPEVNNARFNGNTWSNMRQQRFATLLAHLRKGSEGASKLTGNEYARKESR